MFMFDLLVDKSISFKHHHRRFHYSSEFLLERKNRIQVLVYGIRIIWGLPPNSRLDFESNFGTIRIQIYDDSITVIPCSRAPDRPSESSPVPCACSQQLRPPCGWASSPGHDAWQSGGATRLGVPMSTVRHGVGRTIRLCAPRHGSVHRR